MYVGLYIHGTLNKLLLNIPPTYVQACPMCSALKITHPITANKNVSNICPVSFHVGKIRPSAT